MTLKSMSGQPGAGVSRCAHLLFLRRSNYVKIKERGGSPDSLQAKPLLIGGVMDSEQVQEKTLLPSSFHCSYIFVWLCQLVPFDMHIDACFIHDLLEANQSRSPFCLLSVGAISVYSFQILLAG